MPHYLSPIPDEGLVDIPDSMVDDPAFPLVINNPVSWKKLRCRHDFEYWCRTCCIIKHKTLGKDVPFILNAPQRRVARMLEEDRLARRPIRLIMLKARQWGGSTLIQAYMAWIQSCHCRNWNSIICSQVKDTSSTIRGMYTKILDNYPRELWEGDAPPRLKSFERSENVREIAGRGCRITVASIENLNSVRGSDFALAHLSEVAFWRPTASRSPEDLIRAVCGSVALAPDTLVVMESTANGSGNYFHREWMRCRDGHGDKRAVFVPWYEIEIYSLPPDDPEAFEASLNPYEQMLRDVHGCSPAQINWYRNKLREYPSPREMMAEFPTTDLEAFANTGTSLFASEHVETLRKDCSAPYVIGEVGPVGLTHSAVYGSAVDTPHFTPDSAGRLKVWSMPEPEGDYVMAVDIGGRTNRADWSVIAVMRIDLERPEVVAQWRGHVDHDILANRAFAIGIFYNEALLAVESNSLEHSGAGMFILERLRRFYPRLYFRSPGHPGFHTNSASKGMIITGLMAAVRDAAYIERDNDACDEMLSYEQTESGGFAAKPGAHDDILMTRAIALSIAADICDSPTVPSPPRRDIRRRALCSA